LKFLPKQRYPIRSGVHSNTAFGLIFPLEYALATRNAVLGELIRERAVAYFANDTEFSVASEPGGADFLSPALVEADLMRRVMAADEFERWFSRFLPDPGPVLTPAVVTDRADPQIGHLDGLNLSRAWCMRGITQALSPGNPLRERLLASVEAHTEAGLANVRSGEYVGEHWLATFAVYMLTG
jgi:hypothetical protein